MPLVIPVFIPHQGCPHCCIFCNQHQISGQGGGRVSARDVDDTVQRWLERSRPGTGKEVQVAFYGGSFTGLELSRQEELLGAVAPFMQQGLVQTIRLSTRPDYVDPGIVDFLRRRGVGIVELGVQSLDDAVLEASNRGHTARQSIQAARLLKEGGFQVGVQLMLGLPGQTTRSLLKTARQVASLQPDFARIYPVLVLRGSRLAYLYEQGDFHPLTLGAAVVRAARVKKIFDENSIRVVRMGLQPGPELEKNLLAGPYYPAFGEMVNSRLMFLQTRKLLAAVPEGNRVTLTINEKDQSVFRGLKSANMKRLAELNLAGRFTLQTDAAQPRLSVKMSANRQP
jgi:histone acetyltransferase (RNA polymerase elongator complex component)